MMMHFLGLTWVPYEQVIFTPFLRLSYFYDLKLKLCNIIKN